MNLTKHPQDETSVSRQAGVEGYDQLVARVGHMIWEWEGSDELYGELAERLVRYVLDIRASAKIQAPSDNRSARSAASSIKAADVANRLG